MESARLGIWVVVDTDYHDFHVFGIFQSEEKARQFIETYNNGDECVITEIEYPNRESLKFARNAS